MYYLIEISDGDSKIAGKGVYEYATLDDAVANFHSKLGAAMKSELFISELVMVIDSNGGIYKSEKYEKAVIAIDAMPPLEDEV